MAQLKDTNVFGQLNIKKSSGDTRDDLIITSPTNSGKVILYTSGEGGNIFLASPDGHWAEMDMFNNKSFRLHTQDTNGIYMGIEMLRDTRKLYFCRDGHSYEILNSGGGQVINGTLNIKGITIDGFQNNTGPSTLILPNGGLKLYQTQLYNAYIDDRPGLNINTGGLSVCGNLKLGASKGININYHVAHGTPISSNKIGQSSGVSTTINSSSGTASFTPTTTGRYMGLMYVTAIIHSVLNISGQSKTISILFKLGSQSKTESYTGTYNSANKMRATFAVPFLINCTANTAYSASVSIVNKTSMNSSESMEDFRITSITFKSIISDISDGSILIGTGNDFSTYDPCTQIGAGTLDGKLALGINGTLYVKSNSPTSGLQSVSDIRDKTDFQDITRSLDFVSKLKPVTFVDNHREKYKLEDGSFDTEGYEQEKLKGKRRVAGFIAQDVYNTLKETYDNDNYASIVDYSRYDNPESEVDRYYMCYTQLIPFLTGAIQEMNGTIKEMSDKIKSLEVKIDELEKNRT